MICVNFYISFIDEEIVDHDSCLAGLAWLQVAIFNIFGDENWKLTELDTLIIAAKLATSTFSLTATGTSTPKFCHRSQGFEKIPFFQTNFFWKHTIS